MPSEPASDPSGKYRDSLLIQNALASLKSEERALVVLYEIEGWPVDELASLYGAPTGTIKARLFRARRKMREYLMRARPANMSNLLQEERYALPGCKADTE